MFCKNCGKQIDDNLVQCPYCNTMLNANNVIDSGSAWWGVLGCCIPIVGLVLFLVWKDIKPKTSKKAGIGALIGVILITLSYAFLFIISAGLAAA